jgi:pimeloyl-ACP methyl ester carboxylesterase
MIHHILAISIVVCSAAHATALAQEPAVKKASFDSGGVPIHYLVTGREDGEPVVLIHGFADRGESWAKVIAALKKDFKVIALDCRGHGASGKPHDFKKYGVEMVNDVKRLLAHLEVEKAHIVGYSLGARIALSFAAHHPEHVLSVTLGGNGCPDPSQDKVCLEAAEGLEKDGTLGPAIIYLSPRNRPKPTAADIKRVDDAVLAVNDARALAAVARGVAGDRVLRPSDKQIAALRTPVLAVVGSDDPLRPMVDRLKELLPSTRVIVIDKADHMTAFVRPELVAALRQFLDDNRRRSIK